MSPFKAFSIILIISCFEYGFTVDPVDGNFEQKQRVSEIENLKNNVKAGNVLRNYKVEVYESGIQGEENSKEYDLDLCEQINLNGQEDDDSIFITIKNVSNKNIISFWNFEIYSFIYYATNILKFLIFEGNDRFRTVALVFPNSNIARDFYSDALTKFSLGDQILEIEIKSLKIYDRKTEEKVGEVDKPVFGMGFYEKRINENKVAYTLTALSETVLKIKPELIFSFYSHSNVIGNTVALTLYTNEDMVFVVGFEKTKFADAFIEKIAGNRISLLPDNEMKIYCTNK